MENIKQITIVGTGLLGASCGLGLRAAGFEGSIAGVGRRLATAQRAQALGCVDFATTDLEPVVRESQLVVIAVPLGSYEPLLTQLASVDHEGLTITDVGSTKRQVCDQARRLLPVPSRFVGAHPMAGREQHGPDAASSDLFEGKPCVITDEPDTDPLARQTVERLWTKLGMRLVHMSPDDHDRRVAHISHLPHVIAVLLLALAQERDALGLASTGFRDTTRLAAGDPAIWLEILSSNRQAMIEALDGFDQRCAHLRRLLSESQDSAVLALLESAKRVRENWIQP